MAEVVDVGPWRGPKLEEWLERIAKGHAEDGTPARRKGESWPLIKSKERRCAR